MPAWVWVPAVLAVWLAVAFVLALLIGHVLTRNSQGPQQPGSDEEAP